MPDPARVDPTTCLVTSHSAVGVGTTDQKVRGSNPSGAHSLTHPSGWSERPADRRGGLVAAGRSRGDRAVRMLGDGGTHGLVVNSMLYTTKWCTKLSDSAVRPATKRPEG